MKALLNQFMVHHGTKKAFIKQLSDFHNTGRPAGCWPGLQAQRSSLSCRGSSAGWGTQGYCGAPASTGPSLQEKSAFAPPTTSSSAALRQPANFKKKRKKKKKAHRVWTRSWESDSSDWSFPHRLLLCSDRRPPPTASVRKRVKTIVSMEVLATAGWWGGRTGARLQPLISEMWKEEYDVHFDFLLQLL